MAHPPLIDPRFRPQLPKDPLPLANAFSAIAPGDEWKWTLYEEPNSKLLASAQPNLLRRARQKSKPIPPTPDHSILPFSSKSLLCEELGEDDT